MPTFSNRPPAESTGHNYDVVRCPATGKLRAVITSENLVGCPTHFFRGHTVPCDLPDCPACAEGLPWRWHGYVTIFTAQAHLHQLLELTAPPAEVLAAWFDLHKTLRGCEVILNRTSPRPNGRVRIQTRALDLTGIQLPPAPDLKKILATMWNLPKADQQIAGTLKNHPRFVPAAQPTVPDDRGPQKLDPPLFEKAIALCKSVNHSRGNSSESARPETSGNSHCTLPKPAT